MTKLNCITNMQEKYGYVRVSSNDQNEDRQMIEMKKLGIKPKNIYMDKQSGKDFNRSRAPSCEDALDMTAISCYYG